MVVVVTPSSCCWLGGAMRWVLRSRESGRGGARLGTWEGLESGQVETPALLVHTKGGAVPHLTHEVLMMAKLDLPMVQVPIANTLEFFPAVDKLGQGIAGFVGMQEHPVYCSVQDPAQATPPGYNDSGGISVWSRSGRKQLNVAKYMKVVESYRPCLYQALCDGDTDQNSSKKRIRKAIDRTLTYLPECIKSHQESKVLSQSGILGVIEGGYCIKSREKAATETAQFPVSGFVLDGFHTNGSIEKLDTELLCNVVSSTLQHLPEQKPRVMHGAFDPFTVLQLVHLGIDTFDSSFPYQWTEAGRALTFKFDVNKKDIPKPVETGGGDGNGEPRNGDIGIALKDREFSDDFRPLSEVCCCYTCRKFTRAYIHHLLNVQEMLGSVLLMIHNLHYYREFFKAIRDSIHEDRLENLMETVGNTATPTKVLSE